MSHAVEQLPQYLKPYIHHQNYDEYTAVDHSTWRYIMRQNRIYFSKHGVAIYEKGLKATGIPIHRIPRIEEMDEAMSQFGWGAVPVSCLLYTSPSPRDRTRSRMPSSA